MVDFGVIEPDSRLELLDGALVEQMTQRAPHSTSVGLVEDWLKSISGPDRIVRIQVPIVLDDFSEPEPDVAVVSGSRRAYTTEHPSAANVDLIVDVSDSTLRDDRRRKIPLYARAGIREVWILDLNGRRLFVYTEPDVDEYRLVRTLLQDETVAPVFRPGVGVLVRELLP